MISLRVIGGRSAVVWAYAAGLAVIMAGMLTGCSSEKPANTAPPTVDNSSPGKAPTSGPTSGVKKRIVFVFKNGGGAYSEACKRGAEQAAADTGLNVKVDYQASAEGTAEKQADIVESAIVGHADAIVVSPVDSKAIVPALDKAVAQGIKVFTWDADAPASKRQYYFAAVDDVQIGVDIGDALAKSMGDKGRVLIFSGQSTAENLNNHVKGIEDALESTRGLPLPSLISTMTTTPLRRQLWRFKRCSETRMLQESLAPTRQVHLPLAEAISKNPALNGKIKVWGLSLPSMCSKYLKDETITGLFLWDPQKLTYDTALMVKAVLDGKSLNRGDACGTDGKIEVKGGIVTLPLRLEINKGNVDSLKF